MTLEGAIEKVKKVSCGDWKFNEHDFQALHAYPFMKYEFTGWRPYGYVA